jgi:DegV family protein with EDD domain
MVKIISDSTCDLSQELIRRYDIAILPLHILLAEQEFLDGVNITPDDIYRWSDEHKTTPKTSAVSMEDAIELMKPYLDQGDELICFCISEQMSTTGNVMRLAAEELEAEDRVTVINSENLSTGIGLLVIEAAILASEGKSRMEIAARIETLKPLVRASFVVDTLTYLYRGGRCSGLAAMAGGMLKLHPKIVVKNGVMGAEKKYRGRLSNAILTYAKDMETDLLHAKKDRVFITHSGCDPEVIQSVRDYLESLNYFDEIHITRAGGVVSSHCGWGTLGVLFIAQGNSGDGC